MAGFNGPLSGLAGTGVGNVLTDFGTLVGAPGMGISENAGAGSLNPIGPLSPVSGLSNLATNGGNGWNLGGSGPLPTSSSVSVAPPTPTGGGSNNKGTTSGTNSSMLEGGWYNGQQFHNGQLGPKGVSNWWNVQGPSNPPQQSGLDEQNSAINDLLNSGISGLDTQENYIRNSALPTQLAEAESNANDLLGQVTSGQKDVQNTYDQQSQALANQKSSAMDQARDSYNAMIQAAMSRYGEGSSLGGAVGELSNKQYLQNTGSLQNQYMDQSGQLSNRLMSGLNFYSQQRQQIANDKVARIQAVNDEFNKQLADIESNKSQLGAAAATQRLSALQQAIQNANAIQNMSVASQQELDSWMSKEKYLLSNGYSSIMSQFSNPVGLSTAAPMMPTTNTGQVLTTGNSNFNTNYSPQYDQLGQLVSQAQPSINQLGY